MTMIIAWALLRVNEPAGVGKPVLSAVEANETTPNEPPANDAYDNYYDGLLLAIGTAALFAGMVALFARPLGMALTTAIVMGGIGVAIFLATACCMFVVGAPATRTQKQAFWSSMAFIVPMSVVVGYIASLGL